MSAKVTRSAVFAIKEEVAEGVLVQPTLPSEFTVLREGFSFASEVETVDSDELTNDIGASKSFTTKETPNGSVPKYYKHSGVEGQAPDYGLMLESAMGVETVNSTEYDTVGGSTAGDSTTAAVIKVDAAEGANFSEGQALLIKDSVNGYSIRNVKSVSGDDLTLNYNLGSAPASGVNLGKAVHYSPAATGHPTFSAHLYQASNSSAYHQAMAGCRTTSTSIELPVNDLSTVTFDFTGNEFFMNGVVIDATNEDIDFTDSSSTEVATLTNKTYKTPLDLAAEVASKMSANSVDTISCSFDESTGKFTISSDGGTLDLLWDTGANTLTSAGAALGFDTAADDTGSLTYEADNAQDYSTPVTPAFDDVDPNVVRNNELMIGTFVKSTSRQGSNMSLSVSTPRSDVNDFSSASGVSCSVTESREVEFTTTLILQQHEVQELQDMLKNNTTQLMANSGPKDSAGNWVPGKCTNFYLPNASITSHVIDDQDGFQIVNITAKGFVSASAKDLHLNYI